MKGKIFNRPCGNKNASAFVIPLTRNAGTNNGRKKKPAGDSLSITRQADLVASGLFWAGAACSLLLWLGSTQAQARNFNKLVVVRPGVACHYYNPMARDFGWDWDADDFAQRPRYYARTPVGFNINDKEFSNDEILVKGEKVDGFYVIKEMRLWTLFGGYTKIPAKPTRRVVERFCRETIQRDGYGYQLYDMSVSRALDAYGYPIVFREREDALNAAGYISRVVVFGDSLSDTGRMRGRLGGIGFLSPPYWLGRFANGPNWVDYLSQRLDLAVANWAVGGAVATEVNDAKIHQIKSYVKLGGQHFVSGSTQDQIEKYLNDHAKLVNGKKTLTDPEKTLYIIWIGANDYVSKIDSKGTLNKFIDKPNQQGGHQRTVKRTVQAIHRQLHKLHCAGAKNFLIINLPDIGVSPDVYKRGINYKKRGSNEKNQRILKTSKTFTLAAQNHNKLLQKISNRLQSADKSIRLAYLDIYQAMQGLENETHQGSKFDHGFTFAKQQIEFQGTRLSFAKACYGGNYLGNKRQPESKVCDHPLSALYWDDVHPTTFAHCWLSYFAQKELAKQGLAPHPGSVDRHKLFCERANPHAMPPRPVF